LFLADLLFIVEKNAGFLFSASLRNRLKRVFRDTNTKILTGIFLHQPVLKSQLAAEPNGDKISTITEVMIQKILIKGSSASIKLP